MGYYLYDHQNPKAPVRSNGKRFWGYPQRYAQPVRVVVLHDPETIEDFDGPDPSAENVARYFATTGRSASAHVCSDADSWVPCLPPEAAAFHVIGYNSSTPTWGIEMGYKNDSWLKDPSRTLAILTQSADAIVTEVFEKHGQDIPRRLLTKAQVDAGMTGFVYHSELDPDRRSDPGPDFPVHDLFELIERRLGMDGHPPRTYQEFVDYHEVGGDMPAWGALVWPWYIEHGGTSVPDSWRRPATRLDLAWATKVICAPLEERIKKLEVEVARLKVQVQVQAGGELAPFTARIEPL